MDTGTSTRSNTAIYWLFAISAVLAIIGSLIAPDSTSPWRWLHYLTKPTATLLLLVAVLRGMGSRAYGVPIAIGLAFGAAGDFFLMLPGDYFLAGLVGFLLAHCAYIWALTRDARFGGNVAIFALFAVVAVAVFAGLWSHLPSPMRVPVVIYALVLTTMAAQALSRHRQLAGTQAQPAARHAAIGGLFFMVSDTMLAYGRFRWNIPYNAIWVLGTYYAAQYLFARSTENDAEAKR